MKSEQIDRFVGKKVRIVFTCKVYLEGFLGKGDFDKGYRWCVKGYHLLSFNSPHYSSCGFKKSHIKRIEEIP